ncbi:MAG: DNA-processing protein DprA, partial [Dorea sp.]
MMYEYWLARIRGVSAKKKKKLRDFYGSADKIYYIEETQLKNHSFLTEKEMNAIISSKDAKDMKQQYELLEEKGISFLPYFSEYYPKRLKNIADPPYALYYKGTMPEEQKKSVAIVGSRQCTTYGESLALQYGECLAGAGVQIISGIARGIDGAGQRGALNVDGYTYGILGCGVDVCYP